MANIPKDIKNLFVVPSLSKYLVSQGKVRDIYGNIPEIPDALLIVSTDRLSIFDFVLPCIALTKGEILTALTHFWFTQVLKGERYPNHLLPSASNSRRNAAYDLKSKYEDLPLKRSFVVRKLNILPYELIFRYHLGGSVYNEYLETGAISGCNLPRGLHKWSKLQKPLFTPSTKENDSKDINLKISEFYKKSGVDGYEGVGMFLAAYESAYRYAQKKDFLILDSKGEVGKDKDGKLRLADEIFTPDSSRFTTKDDWDKAMRDGIDPSFCDKEIVRAWGKKVETPFNDGHGGKIKGINNLDPANRGHIDFVHKLNIPQEVTERTKNKYSALFRKLTGYEITTYQNGYML